jgi:hypothetical protein
MCAEEGHLLAASPGGCCAFFSVRCAVVPWRSSMLGAGVAGDVPAAADVAPFGRGCGVVAWLGTAGARGALESIDDAGA